MLAPVKHLLAHTRVVLASGSPRRRELMKYIGLDVKVCPSTFEENLKPENYNEFSDFIEETALKKAEEVYYRLQKENPDANLLVIAADTMVTLGEEIYGKPKDDADAIRMLTNLSGKCNRVYTGVVFKHANGVRQFTDIADVYFGDLSQEQIKAYVDSGDPLDKAGAYGVQGPGGSMISRIDGDFYCVMGLPLHHLCCELITFLQDLSKKP